MLLDWAEMPDAYESFDAFTAVKKEMMADVSKVVLDGTAVMLQKFVRWLHEKWGFWFNCDVLAQLKHDLPELAALNKPFHVLQLLYDAWHTAGRFGPKPEWGGPRSDAELTVEADRRKAMETTNTLLKKVNAFVDGQS